MISQIKQLKKNYSSEPEKPLGAFLYITNKCNLKCRFCEIGVAVKQFEKDISLEEVKDILRQLAEWDVKTLYITGGEPFLRKDIWEVLDFCIEKKIAVSHITTNGTLFEKMSGEQRKTLKKSTKLIQISIDSPVERLHDKGRGMDGVYKKITTFLRESNRREWPAIQLSSFINEGNYREVPELIRFASDLKVDHINFTPVNFVSNFPEMESILQKEKPEFNDTQKLDDLMNVVGESQLLANKLRQSSNLPVLLTWLKEYFQYTDTPDWFFEKAMNRFVCSKPFNYIHINYYGGLMPCSIMNGEVTILGTDIKTEWQRQAKKYKEILLKGDYFPQCKSCYCDFPTNLRNSLIYHPIANMGLNMKLFNYYVKRSF